MKHFFRSFFLLLAISAPAYATVHRFTVSGKDIHEGVVVKQVPLQVYGMPVIRISGATYSQVSEFPAGIRQGNPEYPDNNFTVRIGMEAKKPFALISVPAYSTQALGVKLVLTSFQIEVEEQLPSANPTFKTAKITASATPLATGTWYKIAVPRRGVYKMDFAFLQSLGISGNINSANIRVVGNGGALLSENNAIDRPLDLSDNALWVVDGGDGTLNDGDFVAFYAPGPVRWDKDSIGQRFIHARHLYDESSYYFVSVDAGPGLQITDAPAAGNATTTVTSFNDYAVHDTDMYNPGKFGKTWWGEKFGISSNALPSRNFLFPLYGFADSLRIRLSVASRAITEGNQMTASVNGTLFASYVFGSVALEDDRVPVSARSSDIAVLVNANSADFNLTYNAAPEAIGYLNFIELNWRRPLSYAGSNFSFRDWRSVGTGAVASYVVNGANNASQVWDVTNPLQPQRMSGSLSGSTFTFTQKANALREFVALDGSTFFTPVAIGKTENQNLHSADAPKLVIVTHPDFMVAASQLADYHRQHDGMRVLLTTTQQVYNEFSSGSQDIAGIRDMMRYFYQKAGSDSSLMPRYLLLFGDASYDYKDRINPNSNYVPTFESGDSVNVDYAYTVDDFFGFLDDNEDIKNFTIANTLDIGIGRIPVNNQTEAQAAVNKIIAYHAPASLGPWRLSNTYIGDNEDIAGEHEQDAEDIAAAVDARSPFTNANKIYLDNLPFVSTPSGERCPEANKAINDRIFKGTFLINYTGHGSITTLAHERILIKEDFNQWKNINKMPFMVTATCDYARYDNPAYVSNGEAMIIKADGGSIAMMTTTGPVYAGINRNINQQFLTEQYTQHNGEWPTFGDAIRAGKNITFKATQDAGTLINFYRFTLLGDPAVQPAFPEHVVHTDSVTEMSSGLATDSMKALGKYSVSGHISDVHGAFLADFNGRAYVTIFDKPRLINVITKETNRQLRYYVRDNIIFKGITTVADGRFTVSFIAPKDINYDFGKARISYYAENGVTDAAGMDTTITSGGFFDGAEEDNEGPIVKPFIGDTLFRDGGLTGSNTLLYVQLIDSSGINVSGNSVGHDLIAVLDGDEQHPYVLNDYYETESGTYQRGHASFPVTGLADGEHTFTVRAWDVYNNSGSGSVRFVVGNGKVMQVRNLMNYPNPFAENTHFFFEHNHPTEVLKAQLAIYDMAGKLVRMIETSAAPGGSHGEVIWDGTTTNGVRLQSGVYPYRIILTTPGGIQVTAYQKLVIIR